jgi:hypothetical protein
MALTSGQLTQLKNVALADPTAAAFLSAGNDTELAAWFNANAVPDFWVYRRNINSGEIGIAVSYVAVASMTTANLDRVNNFLNMNRVSFNGRADIKTFLDDTFSGTLGGEGANTRAALDLMLRRLANRFERTFATGTGTSVAPGALVEEGTVNTTIAAQIRTA